jgi:hypothetical protein
MATAWSALAFDTPVDAEGDEVSRMSSSTHLGNPPADLNSKFSIDAEFWFPIGRQVVFYMTSLTSPKNVELGDSYLLRGVWMVRLGVGHPFKTLFLQ